MILTASSHLVLLLGSECLLSLGALSTLHPALPSNSHVHFTSTFYSWKNCSPEKGSQLLPAAELQVEGGRLHGPGRLLSAGESPQRQLQLLLPALLHVYCGHLHLSWPLSSESSKLSTRSICSQWLLSLKASNPAGGDPGGHVQLHLVGTGAFEGLCPHYISGLSSKAQPQSP